MANKPKLITLIDTELIVKEEIIKVLDNNNIKISDDIFRYLLSLMVNSILYPIDISITITDLYALSHQLDGCAKIDSFKKVGDTAIYLSGYFPEYVAKRFGLEFYNHIGKISYDKAYSLSGDIIYLELFNSYNNIVEIISEISEQKKIYNYKMLTETYVKWLSTKDPSLEKKLNKNGFLTKIIIEA